ncbi:MAG: sulfatase-like hydrolase/transferase, partial [Micromonosporaceae bacterium]
MTRLTAWTSALVALIVLSPVAYGVGFAGAAYVTAEATSAQEVARVSDQTPPNVVVITTDDMRADDLAGMPNTRRLLAGDNGARYINSWTSLPLCCPSRATFLTGQTATHNGVWSNEGPHGGAPALNATNTLATWLQPTYRTVMLGKYLNLYGPDSMGLKPPAGWDHWAALYGPRTYNYHRFDINVNGDLRAVEGYQTRDFTRRALRQLRAPGGQPTFMWLSLLAPHTELIAGDGPQVRAEPRYAGQSRVGLPDSPAVDERSIADKPDWMQRP